MIKLVVFDWAGTTVDYGCMAPVAAFRKAFALYNIDVSDAQIRKPMGILKLDHIRNMLDNDEIKKKFYFTKKREYLEKDVIAIYDAFEKYIFETLIEYATPIQGIIEVVAELREKGIKIGSTTGYTKDMMAIITEQAAIEGYQPDYLITPDVIGKGRPFPAMIYDNMRALKVENKAMVIKVGDTVVDIEEGKNAGVISVGVIKGSSLLGKSIDDNCTKEEIENTRKLFIDAGADYVLDSIVDLPALIEAL